MHAVKAVPAADGAGGHAGSAPGLLLLAVQMMLT